MRLHIDDGLLHAGRKGQERVEPGKAASVLEAQGHRPTVALAIAHGELSTPTRAKALARRTGLLTVDTGEARKKGLLL